MTDYVYAGPKKPGTEDPFDIFGDGIRGGGQSFSETPYRVLELETIEGHLLLETSKDFLLDA